MGVDGEVFVDCAPQVRCSNGEGKGYKHKLQILLYKVVE